MFARAIGLALVGLVLACSGPETAPPDPAAILRQAGQAMAGLHSVSADVKFGPGIELQGLTLSSATSKLQLPDQSDTMFQVKQGDFLVDVRVVTTGGHVYLRLPFSGFTELSAEQAKELPDLTQLLDRRTGLPAILAAGRTPAYQGTEQAAGIDSDRVTTSYTADQLGTLLGVKPAGDIQATIWAGRSDHLLRRVVLNGPMLAAGKNVRVQVDLHDFNQPVVVATPS